MVLDPTANPSDPNEPGAAQEHAAESAGSAEEGPDASPVGDDADLAHPAGEPAAVDDDLDEDSSAEHSWPTTPVELPDFSPSSHQSEEKQQSIDLLHNVNLRVRVELGRTHMKVEDVLNLGDGSVVELDKLAGDPVEIFANDRLIARGEVLVLNDNFCVRVSEITDSVAGSA